jgi:hypothetical protein
MIEDQFHEVIDDNAEIPVVVAGQGLRDVRKNRRDQARITVAKRESAGQDPPRVEWTKIFVHRSRKTDGFNCRRLSHSWCDASQSDFPPNHG